VCLALSVVVRPRLPITRLRRARPARVERRILMLSVDVRSVRLTIHSTANVVLARAHTITDTAADISTKKLAQSLLATTVICSLLLALCATVRQRVAAGCPMAFGFHVAAAG
jgi:hypothetical protein